MWFLPPKWTQTYTQLVLGVVPEDRPTKMEFEDWFGHALEHERSAELLDNEKQDVSNPQQVSELQLINKSFLLEIVVLL